VKRSLDGVRAAFVWTLLLPLRLYQRVISPVLPRRCKYEPTCSAYTAQALRELGPLRGTLVAAWRLARCNPLSHGGYDPFEARKLFPPDAPDASPADGREAAA
jgi:putative membrane protein insertion efficiency factor